MSYYWDPRFLKHIDIDNVNYLFEAGARYGDESLKLSTVFPHAKIWSFECNPNTVNICRNKLKDHKNITFCDYGLGNKEETLPFYSFTDTNDGGSSFFKRIDFDTTQKFNGEINIKKINNIVKEYDIPYIDLLCMDVQGFEMNILKGCEDFIEKIHYIIMEVPKEIINLNHLPENTHSKYIGAPSYAEIKEFMDKNNFVEIERIEENKIEDNIMYCNRQI